MSRWIGLATIAVHPLRSATRLPVLLLVLCAVACAGDVPDAAYLGEIESWRQQRLENLTSADGWLAVVGLYWLDEGRQSFGTDPTNDIVFPAGAGAEILGELEVAGGDVRIRVREGVTITHEGEKVTSMHLQSDREGPPTVLSHGTLRFYLIDRGGRLALRLKDSASAARLHFPGIDSYPIDEAWRLPARFEAYDPPRPIPIPTVLGTVVDELSPGAVVFELGGQLYRLDTIRYPDTDELFIVFGDQTNRNETYGGGRFLYVDPPAEGATVVVDFNKAYNPPCAFTAHATCPLPPPQNRLAVRIEAGERRFRAGPGH